jgi:hypothetical protein
LPHRSGVGGYPAAARHPPDEWHEPGGLVQAYKPGPNVCSNPALHRSSHLTKPLRCQPQQRQHRRLATLDLAVESCEEHHPASPPPRRAPPPSAHRPPGDAPHEKPEKQQMAILVRAPRVPVPTGLTGNHQQGRTKSYRPHASTPPSSRSVTIRFFARRGRAQCRVTRVPQKGVSDGQRGSLLT